MSGSITLGQVAERTTTDHRVQPVRQRRAV